MLSYAFLKIYRTHIITQKLGLNYDLFHRDDQFDFNGRERPLNYFPNTYHLYEIFSQTVERVNRLFMQHWKPTISLTHQRTSNSISMSTEYRSTLSISLSLSLSLSTVLFTFHNTPSYPTFRLMHIYIYIYIYIYRPISYVYLSFIMILQFNTFVLVNRCSYRSPAWRHQLKR